MEESDAGWYFLDIKPPFVGVWLMADRDTFSGVPGGLFSFFPEPVNRKVHVLNVTYLVTETQVVSYFYDMPRKKKRKGPAPGTVYSDVERTELGKRIVTLRHERGMSQTDLAKKTELTKRMISFYETSAVAVPLERMMKIASALSVGLDELAKLQLQPQNGTTTSRALLKRLESAKQLPEAKQKLLIGMIDEMLGKKE